VCEHFDTKPSPYLITFPASRPRQSPKSLHSGRLHNSSRRVHRFIPAAHQGHDALR
jgi:hypothetical protein